MQGIKDVDSSALPPTPKMTSLHKRKNDRIRSPLGHPPEPTFSLSDGARVQVYSRWDSSFCAEPHLPISPGIAPRSSLFRLSFLFFYQTCCGLVPVSRCMCPLAHARYATIPLNHQTFPAIIVANTSLSHSTPLLILPCRKRASLRPTIMLWQRQLFG